MESFVPKSLEILQDFFSDEEIISFANHFAGQTIYIPSKLKKNHPLLVCGEEVCARLIDNFSGYTFNVPLLSYLRKFRRNLGIHQYRHSGWSIPLLSQYFEISKRQTFLILSKDVSY